MTVFKDCGLRITIQANLQKVNFLDIQLDLNTSTYQPYRKPDNNPVYLTKIPITSTKVLKELPKSIEKHVSGISLNEMFSHNRHLYITMLHKSGFAEQLKYIASDNN